MTKSLRDFIDSLFQKSPLEQLMEEGKPIFMPPDQPFRVKVEENADGTMNLILINPETSHSSTNQGLMNLSKEMTGRMIDRLIQFS